MNYNYQRPRKLEVEELTDNYGKFVAEPFERGYGNTIGIALRRVLLSLIEGDAITAVRIDGVLHEFAAIPGVYEDVLNIILNLKTIPFKLNSTESKIIKIEKHEAGEIVSGDIITDSDVIVLDKNIHIAYLEEGGSFTAEARIQKGVGFKLAEQNYDEELSVDFISVDANFNPVEKVKYTVVPARVGKRTDFEKLILEVWTNGSISPKETVSRAGKILRDHLTIFLDYQDKENFVPAVEQEAGLGIENKSDILEKSVEAMDAKEVGVALHSIANIAGHLLAVDVVQSARRLEKRCYLGELETILEEVEALKPRLLTLTRAVESELVKL